MVRFHKSSEDQENIFLSQSSKKCHIHYTQLWEESTLNQRTLILTIGNHLFKLILTKINLNLKSNDKQDNHFRPLGTKKIDIKFSEVKDRPERKHV